MKSTLPAARGLVDSHYATVHHAALGLGMSKADAQDLTQTVWETVLRRLSEYDQRRPFPTWLLGITYQMARNFRKVRRRAERLFDRGKEPAEVEPSAQLGPATPEEELTRKEEMAIAMQEIRRLRPELQTVFLMAEAEKLRHEEIAARLGLTTTTVAWRLRAAWEIIERRIHRRRLAGLLAAILAAGLSSLVAARAVAQTLARRARIAGKRLTLHVVTVCAIGMLPMTGAVLPAVSLALSWQAPERAVQGPPRPAEHTGPAPDQGASVGARGAILSAVQAPLADRPAPAQTKPATIERRGAVQATPMPAPPVEAVHENSCGEQTAKPDRCESPPEAQPSKLAGELMLLQQVRTALRARNIPLARRLLQGYDAEYPQGILRKERDQLGAEIAAYTDR